MNRYIGNPVLTGFLNLFFRTGVRDAHCGMRAVRRDVLPQLDLRSTGMEFASEMVIRAAKEELDDPRDPDRVPPARRRVEALELPRRLAPPALPARAQPDLPLPRPGRADGCARTARCSTGRSRSVNVFGRTFYVHTLIAGSLLHVVGTQVLALGLCARAYGVYYPRRARSLVRARCAARFRLEHGLLARRGVSARRARARRRHRRAAGSSAASASSREERLAILAATLVIVGIQIFFSSFLLSILGLRRR